MVYVGSYDGYLYALDRKTGAMKWRYRTEKSVRSSPAVDDHAVYFGSMDSKFYAVE